MTSSFQPYMDWESNGPSYLTDIDVEEEATSTGEDEEIWHVAVSWDDIKLMSLDQLDDAFRLDVIAADTPVWKEGMADWQPLSVVAGMEDEASEEQYDDDELTVLRPMPIPVAKKSAAPRAPSPPPRPPTSRAPSPPPRPPTPPTRAASRAPAAPAPAPAFRTAPPMSRAPIPPQASRAPIPPAPMSRAPAPPVRQQPIEPVSLRNASPRSAAPLRSVPASPVKTQPRMAAVHQPPSAVRQTQPASLPPNANLAFAHSMRPAPAYVRPRMRKSSGGQAWFFAPLVLMGGLFAAYRNDLLLDGARAIHQEERYLQAERALLGVPGFGTPRSVAAASELTGDVASDSVNSTKTLDETATEPTRDAPTTIAEAPKAEAVKPEPAAPVTPPPVARATVESKPAPTPPPVVETHKAVVAERSASAPPAAKAAPKAAPAPVRAVAMAAPPRPEPKAEPAPKSSKHGPVKAAKVILSESDDEAPAPVAHRASSAATKAATKAAASFGSQAHDEPEPVAVAPKKEKPAAPPKVEKPAPPPPVVSSGNSMLDEAIKAAAAKKTNAPAKKKGPNAEYDPLNSDL